MLFMNTRHPRCWIEVDDVSNHGDGTFIADDDEMMALVTTSALARGWKLQTILFAAPLPS
jgi:hypothetical protein